ncbi:MAG: uncharacterized protein QOK16_4640 [Solirubrobacteraceae bacterium]|nr:uncharacterized protein [Solirubrobacteraceae bacterium]
MSATSRNAPCPCGSGRKFKRCCADVLDHPQRVAKEHDAVGERIRAWAFQHHHDAIRAALADITAGHEDVVLGDADIELISTWALGDRELPGGGGTLAQRYARRPDLPADESDVARRIAAARLGVLRVVSVQPGHWIEFDNLAGGGHGHVMSHGVSRAVRRDDMLVARIMEGPPARSLWGPVGRLTRETGRELLDLLKAGIESSGLHDEPGGLATAMHLAAREITTLLAPGLGRAREFDRAA